MNQLTSRPSIYPKTDFSYSLGTALDFADSERTQNKEAEVELQGVGTGVVILRLLQIEKYSTLVFVVRIVAGPEVHFGLSLVGAREALGLQTRRGSSPALEAKGGQGISFSCTVVQKEAREA